jgi:hypothetical protein
MRCEECFGAGYCWIIPVTVNPFVAKIESVVLAMKKIPCWQCGGSGFSYCCSGECAEPNVEER